jgi:DNA-binding Lrp family transcriptional regulator
MARLDQTGVFQSFERSISPSALGFPLQAFVSIGLDQSKLPQIIEELRRVPEVVEAHGVSGQVDLFALVACRDARHLFDVDARILAIPGIERSETRLVMSESIPYRVTGLMELARRETRR